MADRYWVGLASEFWNANPNTKWSATPGGVGGETVPSINDDVFFDVNSNNCALSIPATRTCRNLNFTGYTKVFHLSSANVVVSGNVTLSPTMTWNTAANGYIICNTDIADARINTAGIRFSLKIDANTGNVTITDTSDTFFNRFLYVSGTIDLSNKNLHVANLIINTAAVAAPGTLNLENSSVTLNATAVALMTTLNNGNANVSLNFTNAVFRVGNTPTSATFNTYLPLDIAMTEASRATISATSTINSISSANLAAITLASPTISSMIMGSNVSFTATGNVNINSVSFGNNAIITFTGAAPNVTSVITDGSAKVRVSTLLNVNSLVLGSSSKSNMSMVKGPGTINLSSNHSFVWTVFDTVTFTGATFTASDSLAMGVVSGVTIETPINLHFGTVG